MFKPLPSLKEQIHEMKHLVYECSLTGDDGTWCRSFAGAWRRYWWNVLGTFHIVTVTKSTITEVTYLWCFLAWPLWMRRHKVESWANLFVMPDRCVEKLKPEQTIIKVTVTIIQVQQSSFLFSLPPPPQITGNTYITTTINTYQSFDSTTHE